MASIMLLSAIFITAASLILFSFLYSPKSRDFYCSTPNSICTLWLSFASSIMTWAAVGILAGNLIQLPFILISDVKYFMTWLTSLVSTFAFALLVMGIISLALSLTGKIIPAIITIAGIALMPAMLHTTATATFSAFFGQFYFITNEPDSFPDVFSVLFRAIFMDIYPSYGLNEEFSIFSFLCSSSAIIYNLLLGVVYLAAAAWFMTIRTGDAAGKPFVNKVTHIISLLVVTFDVTAIVGTVLTDVICDMRLYPSYYSDTSEIMDIILITVICLVATVISFWVCELILTFNIKKSYRALKFLPVPIVAVAVITGVGYLCFNADIRTAPKADEIKSVTLVRNEYLSDELAIFRMYGTYGRLVTNEAEFTDKQIINYVSGQIGKFVDSYDKSVSDTADYYMGMGSETQAVNLKINLKDGRTITRTIEASDDFFAKLKSAMTSDSDYMKDFLAIPDASYTNICISDINGLKQDDVLKIYQTFSEEYSKMSDKDKLAYMKANLYYDYDDSMVYVEDYDEEYYDEEGFVSASDFILENKSYKQGDYETYMDGYSLNRSIKSAEIFSINVSGYKDGRFYDENAYFSQVYSISYKYFPKTIETLAEICNENLNEFSEIKGRINKTSYLTLDTCYYGKDSVMGITYSYINEGDVAWYEDTQAEYNIESGYYENGEYQFDNEEDYITRLIEIDGKDYVAKLFDDAAKAETIDFSKPYCRVNVYFDETYLTSHDDEEYTVFVQTDSLIDLLELTEKTSKETSEK